MISQPLGIAALLKAIYTRLTTSAFTSAYRVYNYVPATASFPYIRFGDPVVTAKGAADHAGHEISVLFHALSEGQGDKAAAEILNNICKAITAGTMSLDGYTQLSAILESVDIRVDESESARDVYHGTATFRFWIEPTS
jgi:hypothetical protein